MASQDANERRQGVPVDSQERRHGVRADSPPQSDKDLASIAEARALARAPADLQSSDDGYWCPVERLGEEPLPSLMRKVVEHGLKGATR